MFFRKKKTFYREVITKWNHQRFTQLIIIRWWIIIKMRLGCDVSLFEISHFIKQRKVSHLSYKSRSFHVSWDYKQAPYCLQEVWHSLVKWVRGESQKQHALTTCDPHLNSFHHDISLNQPYKRQHCIAWCGLGWTRVIVQPDLRKKTRAGQSLVH